MLRSLSLAIAVRSTVAFNAAARAASTRAGHVRMASSIADFKANKLDGTPCDLSAFKGKPTLVLNVASL